MMRAAAAIVAVLALLSPAVTGHGECEGEGERRFVLDKGEQVVKTDGGEVRVVRGRRWDGDRNKAMHIGFISMEPNTLFIPQYIDASLILFVRTGDARVGWIYKDGLVEKQLKMGDINRIPAGSAFYIVNTGKGQRLQIICSIDTTADYGWDWLAPPYQSFFLGGGEHPKSVLSGFGVDLLSIAFNVSVEEASSITGGKVAGPIVYITGEAAADQPRRLSSILSSKLEEIKEAYSIHGGDRDGDDGGESGAWAVTGLFRSIFGYRRSENKKSGPVRGPESYNIYGRDPSFKNRYGWTIALDARDYHPLKHSNVGVYLVNLTAGSMLAPHLNPRAVEYGVVLGGSGTVQVVYPNGTCAMKAEVYEGDVFWIPRFFPFCQVASRGGPLVIFGFTTSARDNHPQFLAGASSVVRAMVGPEMAAGMGVGEDLLRRLVTAQNYSVVLPPRPEESGRGKEERGEEKTLRIKRVVRV